ncbi:PPC domain-containing DNA-binding protein [Algihabitans albus]|uniref:PPC domain-containing DNA-binding protein n=1 Tax=Algihabitans albus TaxID=2164067 RepID=UPI0035CFD8D5
MSDAMTGADFEAEFEDGRFGRLAVVRLKPDQDLVEGIEAAAMEAGIAYGVVRAAVGSLVDAALGYGEAEDASIVTVEGPGIEILTLAGELRPDENGQARALLQGTISDADAKVYGGTFLRGANPICITLELVLQEWVPEAS